MASFRHIGGDVFWRSVCLSADDVKHLQAVYRDEAWAAFHAGDDVAYEAASALLGEVCDALKEQARWTRAGEIRRAA
jgi:hypothetical protein